MIFEDMFDFDIDEKLIFNYYLLLSFFSTGL